jgi:hypothetical protein
MGRNGYTKVSAEVSMNSTRSLILGWPQIRVKGSHLYIIEYKCPQKRDVTVGIQLSSLETPPKKGW